MLIHRGDRIYLGKCEDPAPSLQDMVRLDPSVKEFRCSIHKHRRTKGA